MDFNYASIAPLVSSSELSGSVLQVVFQDAQGGPSVSATGTLRTSGGVVGATRSTIQRQMLSRLSFAVTRAVSSALGDNVVSRFGAGIARSAVQDAGRSATVSAEAKEAAVVEAFQSVSSQFRWDGAAWVSAPPSAATLEFTRLLDKAPITARGDLAVLGRMLVELAGADGDIGDDERSFLASFLTGDVDVDSLAAGPPLTDAELAEVTQGPVRESMLMLAWGLSFCDDALADAEQDACRRFARGLRVAPARRKVLRSAAAEFVRGQAVD